MADKVIVLGIELDVQDLVKAAQTARQTLSNLKDEQKALKEAGQENTRQWEENAAAIRVANVELRNAQKTLDNTTKARQEETGSINQMRAQLSLATAEYNKLSEAERTGSKRGKEFAAEIKNLSDNLKTAESAIGDNRRNVGNYAGGIKDALTQLNLMPGALGSVIKGAEGAGNAFKAAFINPWVAVATLVLGVILKLADAFAKTEEGGNEFAVIGKQISAIFDVLIQRVAAFASGLVSFFKGDFAEGARKMGDAFTGIGDQIAEATAAARDYVLAIKDVNDATIEFISQTAKNRNEIAKLEAIAGDQTKSTEERRAALKQAIAIGEEELKFQKELADKKFTAEVRNAAVLKGISEQTLREFISADAKRGEELKKGNADLTRALASLGDDGVKNLEELYAASINLDTNFFEENKKNLSKITAFDKQIQDDRVKAAKDSADKRAAAEKTALDDALAATKLQLAGVKTYQDEYLRLTIQRLGNERDIELNNAQLTANQKLVIQKDYEQKVADATAKFLKDQNDANTKALADRLKQYDDINAQQDLKDATRLAQQKTDLANQLAAGVISEQEYANQIDQIVFDAEQKKKQNRIDTIDDELMYLSETSPEYIRLFAERSQLEAEVTTDTEKRKRDEMKTTEKLAKQSAANQLKFAEDQFGQIAGLFKDGSAAFKTFSLFQITASTASGAIGAYARASETFPAPLGQILGAIAAAAVVAEGAKRAAEINSKSFGDGGIVPHAARGIIIGGEPHSRGGTSFVGSDGTRFVAERDELLAVVNKRSTRMLRSLSDINVAGGGRKFFDRGGIASGYLADGGFAARAATVPIINNINNQIAIQDFIDGMPRPVVIVQDINDAQGKLTDVENGAVI